MNPAPKKRFGQNFLVNSGVVRKILAAAHIRPNEPLLEIGPGLGALTTPLAALGNPLTLVEADRDMIAQLTAQCATMPHVRIVHGDVLQHDPGDSHPPRCVLGNIPYNISSPILFWLIEHRARFSRAILMVQREVGLRVAAGPGSKTYGALSIGVQAYAQVKKLFDVQPGSFRPAPKVTSSVIQLTFADPPPYRIADPVTFRNVVRHAFSQRRKMMRGLFADAHLATAGIAPTTRPETCTIVQFVALAAATAAANPLA